MDKILLFALCACFVFSAEIGVDECRNYNKNFKDCNNFALSAINEGDEKDSKSAMVE